LIPKNRLFFEVGKKIGPVALTKILFYGFLYGIWIIDLKRALSRIFRVLHRANVALLTNAFEKLPLMPDAKIVFAELRSNHYKIALISSGLPTFLVEELRHKLGADYAVGFELGIENNVLTGEIKGDVIEAKGKLVVLERIVAAEGIAINDCSVVADDRNNLSIFLKDIRKIGFNPDFILRIKADFAVSGNLRKVLPLIYGQTVKKKAFSKNEIARETIHASGLFVPIIAALYGINLVAIIISSIVLIYTLSELMRLKGRSLPIISEITRLAASPSEFYGFTFAPIYFALGILLALLFFPFPASSVAIVVFASGDSAASLLGSLFSKKGLRINRAKTIEGSLGGFLFASLAGSFFTAPWIALFGAAIAMTVEFLPLPINDNASIPVLTALALTIILYWRP
jgi:phytol kinase